MNNLDERFGHGRAILRAEAVQRARDNIVTVVMMWNTHPFPWPIAAQHAIAQAASDLHTTEITP